MVIKFDELHEDLKSVLLHIEYGFEYLNERLKKEGVRCVVPGKSFAEHSLVTDKTKEEWDKKFPEKGKEYLEIIQKYITIKLEELEKKHKEKLLYGATGNDNPIISGLTYHGKPSAALIHLFEADPENYNIKQIPNKEGNDQAAALVGQSSERETGPAFGMIVTPDYTIEKAKKEITSYGGPARAVSSLKEDIQQDLQKISIQSASTSEAESTASHQPTPQQLQENKPQDATQTQTVPNNTESQRKNLIDKLLICETTHFKCDSSDSLDFLTFLGIAKKRISQGLEVRNTGLECIENFAKKENNDILLYLFLNTFTEEEKKTKFFNDISNFLEDDKKQKIEQTINNYSSSTSPNPPIYKGWGVRFNQSDISIEEESGKKFLFVKIDEIFSRSKLEGEGVKQYDVIKIDLDKVDIDKLKKDGKLDVGEVAKLIRKQESLTIQITKGILTIEKEKKNHFYKGEGEGEDNKYRGFLVDLDNMSQGDFEKQEAAIKTAFGKAETEKLAKPEMSPEAAEVAVALTVGKAATKTPSSIPSPTGSEAGVVPLDTSFTDKITHL